MTGLLLCPGLNTLNVSANIYTGSVKDNDGNPMEFANVVLINPKDSTIITASVTDLEGNFKIENERHPVNLEISAMGFENIVIENPQEKVGIVFMQPSVYALGEVVVTSSRPIAKLNSEGIQIAISGTYLSNAGTALDLLGKLPFVLKNGNEIEVIGKGVPEFYINGRKVRDFSEIEQLSSNQIKNIDVVTSPGARYDATVNSVIKITTVAPVGEGFSFTDRTTIGYKHYVYLFEQANLNYRKNGFDLFGTLVYENYRERPKYESTTWQYLKSGVVKQNSNGKEFSKYPVYEGKIGLNYTKGENYFGFYYDFSFKPSFSESSSHTSRFIDEIFSQDLEDLSLSDRHNRQHLFSAYYNGNINKWELSANFDAVLQYNDKNSLNTEFSTLFPARDFTTTNDIQNRLLSGNMIATVPLWKGNFSFGTEITNILRKDLYKGNADYIQDSDNKIEETNYALFAETRQSFGSVEVGAGIRMEYTDSRFYNFGVLQPEESKKYLQLSPSASVSFPIGNISTSISYTRKTSRPGFEQLSSAVKYIDRYMYESGNPNLKPVYRDYLSISGQWKNLIVELEYISTINYFMWQTFPYNESEDILITSLQNIPRFNSYGAFVNYSPTFFGIWHPNFMAGVEIQDFKLIHNNLPLTLNKPLGIFRFNNAIHLPWDIWCNLDFSARTTGNSENLYVKSQWGCNFSFFKSFANDKWTIKLQLNDVFDTMKTEFILYDAISLTRMEKIYDTRDLQIVFTYNFNSGKSRYKGRGSGNDDKGRL